MPESTARPSETTRRRRRIGVADQGDFDDRIGCRTRDPGRAVARRNDSGPELRAGCPQFDRAVAPRRARYRARHGHGRHRVRRRRAGRALYAAAGRRMAVCRPEGGGRRVPDLHGVEDLARRRPADRDGRSAGRGRRQRAQVVLDGPHDPAQQPEDGDLVRQHLRGAAPAASAAVVLPRAAAARVRRRIRLVHDRRAVLFHAPAARALPAREEMGRPRRGRRDHAARAAADPERTESGDLSASTPDPYARRAAVHPVGRRSEPPEPRTALSGTASRPETRSSSS
ncbi:hypothetical protein EMIT0111MI5_11209 [Burkholderia sp. IT-111MI5]